MIEVIQPGVHSTIQDVGRLKHREQGVPTGGAMDQHAFVLANHILQHATMKPVIEFTLKGPTLYFHGETYITLTGGKFQMELNGKVISHAKAVFVPAKSTLKIGQSITGNYGYLCILGGFNTKQVLDSGSYHPSILPSSKLKKGMQFFYIRPTIKKANHYSRINPIHDKFCRTKLAVYPGPEFHLLSKAEQDTILGHSFFVSPKSNRMAIQLSNTPVVKAPEIITAPVQPGTVQLTPAGQFIVLMRDAQTTGGYARILQLTDHAINSLSQCKVGEQEEISMELLSE